MMATSSIVAGSNFGCDDHDKADLEHLISPPSSAFATASVSVSSTAPAAEEGAAAPSSTPIPTNAAPSRRSSAAAAMLTPQMHGGTASHTTWITGRKEKEDSMILRNVLQKFQGRSDYGGYGADDVDFVHLIGVESERRFYVRPESLSDAFQCFHETWSAVCTRQKEIDSLLVSSSSHWKRGQICGVLHQGTWCRGVILRLSSRIRQNRLKVHLLDLGVGCFVDPSDLMTVTDEKDFHFYPPFAICCKMVPWGPDIRELAKNFTRKCLMVVMGECEGPEQILPVFLAPPTVGSMTALNLPETQENHADNRWYTSRVDHKKLKGTMYKVRITSFERIDLFYVQPLMWNRASEALAQEVHAFYSAHGHEDIYDPEFTEGSYCVVPVNKSSSSSTRMMWVRAQITKVDDENLTVFICDAGYKDEDGPRKKDPTTIRKLAPQFHPDEFPLGSLPCCFWDVRSDGRRQNFNIIKTMMNSLRETSAFFCGKVDGGEKWEVQVLGVTPEGFATAMSFSASGSQIGTTDSRLYGIPQIDFDKAGRGFPDPKPPLNDTPSDVCFLGFDETDPSVFYVQLQFQSGWFFRSQGEGDTEALMSQLDLMYIVYGTLTRKMFLAGRRGRNEAELHLRPGMICVAPWKRPNCTKPVYVRAVVLEVIDFGRVRMRAVDFAFDFECEATEMMWMVDSHVLCHVPPYAVKCRFLDVNLPDRTLLARLTNELLGCGSFQVVFTSSKPDEYGCFPVLVIIDEECVSRELLKHNFATHRSPAGMHVLPRYRPIDYDLAQGNACCQVRVSQEKLTQWTTRRFILIDKPDDDGSTNGELISNDISVPATHIYPGYAYAVNLKESFYRAVAMELKDELWEVELVDCEMRAVVKDSDCFELPLTLLFPSRRFLSCSLAAVSDLRGDSVQQCFRHLASLSHSSTFHLILEPGRELGDPRFHPVVLYLMDRERGHYYSINDILGKCYKSDGFPSEIKQFLAGNGESVTNGNESYLVFADESPSEKEFDDGGEIIAALSPYSFFFRPEQWKKRYEEMQSDICRSLEIPSLAKPSEFSCGSACLALREGILYRGRINSYDAVFCTVFLVDLGLLEKIRLERIYAIPRRLLEIHCMAVHCRSGQIVPLNSAGVAKQILPCEIDWPDRAINAFKNCVLNKKVKLTLLGPKIQGRYPVNVVVCDEGRGGRVKDLAKDFMSQDPPLAASVGQLRTRLHYRQTVPRDCGEKGWMKGRVTYAYSPAYFYWQFQDWEVIANKVESLLKNFTGSTMNAETLVAVGTACVAPYFDGNDNFYRSVITGYNSLKAKCEVTFVDYGNKEQCRVDRIFSPTLELMAIPRVCVRCALKNVQSRLRNAGTSWLLPEVELFQNLTLGTLGSPAMSQILVEGVEVQRHTQEIFLLVRLKNADGVDVGETIMDRCRQ